MFFQIMKKKYDFIVITRVMYLVDSILQPHNSVLPVASLRWEYSNECETTALLYLLFLFTNQSIIVSHAYRQPCVSVWPTFSWTRRCRNETLTSRILQYFLVILKRVLTKSWRDVFSLWIVVNKWLNWKLSQKVCVKDKST